MAAEREHDKWLEHLLGPRLAGETAASSDACLDAETLAAWADGSLNANELVAAELHASNCSRCTTLFAAIGRSAPPASVPSRSKGGLFRWLVPLAAAATAIAFWVAIPGQQQIAPVAREVVVPPATVAPPPAELPTSVPPVASPESKAELRSQPQRSPRLDDFAPVAEDERLQARRERAGAGNQASADRVKQAPAAAPRPAAPDMANQQAAAALALQALNETVAVVIEGVSPDDPRIHWRSPSGVDIERSIDGGQTWMKTPAMPPAPVTSIQVKDALTATVTTSDGRTFSTTDGGKTWASVQEKPPAPF